jgi:hypothetical protein
VKLWERYRFFAEERGGEEVVADTRQAGSGSFDFAAWIEAQEMP